VKPTGTVTAGGAWPLASAGASARASSQYDRAADAAVPGALVTDVMGRRAVEGLVGYHLMNRAYSAMRACRSRALLNVLDTFKITDHFLDSSPTCALPVNRKTPSPCPSPARGFRRPVGER
jgi:hypothetical protein